MRLVRKRVTGRLLPALALFACALAFCMLLPGVARAAETSVSTATANASYEHPNTGVIEDAGGSSSAALGQSMVEGVVDPRALVEVDAAGDTYVTLRLGMADQVGDVSFSYDADGTGSSYEEAAAEMTGEDADENTADYRFAVADAESVVRCSLFVTPMGRSVVFFVTLSDATEGNAAGFAARTTPGEPLAADSAGSGSDAGGEAAAGDAGVASDASDATQEASSQGGIQEYDAQGNEVSASDGAQDAEGGSGSGVGPFAIGAVCAAAVAIAAGAAGYFGWYRPKRARESAAAAAAARAAGDPSPRGDSDTSGSSAPEGEGARDQAGEERSR